MDPYVSLILGIALAAAGGELFVAAVVGISQRLRVPARIVGATIAAFATSSPEMFVALNAAYDGTPQIALGDAVGSNLVNLGLVLGIALCISPIKSGNDYPRADFLVALGAPILTALLVLDGVLSRLDAGIVLFSFASWLIYTLRGSRSSGMEQAEQPSSALALVKLVLGLGALVFAGSFLVHAGKGIGEVLGLDPFVAGATLVAFGTSAPELATTLVSSRRGHDHVGLGTVLGSNIFNGLFIVGLVALIHPFTVSRVSVIAGLIFGVGTVAIVFVSRRGSLSRITGACLLAIYASYISLVVSRVF